MSRSEVVQQAAEMPMQTVIERPINMAGPGPYYVYLPGFTIHDMMRMTDSFASLPGGQVFRIDSATRWAKSTHLPEGAARSERIVRNFFGVETDRHASIQIPAQTIKDSLFSDRALTVHNIVEIANFATHDVEHLTLNRMINPATIEELSKPREWKDQLDREGMLALRLRWLNEAAEALETGRMLEDYRRVIDARPFLRDLWHDAIVKVLLPTVETFIVTANTILAQKEEAIRSGQKNVYDTYDQTLMWLLARKPERTALSRALEPGKGGGVGIEEIRTLVQEVVGATAAQAASAVAPAHQQVQCTDCGEFLNMVAGGFPRKCRHCGYEFQVAYVAAAVATADEALGAVEAVPVNVAPDPDLESMADQLMADQIQSKSVKRR